MYKFLPYMTNDYSVGLYNEDTNDIYHSAFGALTEAFEKFGNSLTPMFENNTHLKALDICYGIGYNTKALLQNAISHSVNIDIDCVDTDGTLMELSPFVSSYINLFDRIKYNNVLYKNIQNYHEAEKIVKLKTKKSDYVLEKKVNYIILKNLLSMDDLNSNFQNLSNEVIQILNEKENRPFFDKNMAEFCKFWSKIGIQLYQNKNKSAFVHNIYYRYLSKRYKILKNLLKNDNYKLNFYKSDIRYFIKQTDSTYDIIMLDGFTPAKCPAIWSVEMFKELYTHLSDTGRLVTYNMSAPVRHAMKLAGFNVGNITNDEKEYIGTIATKNQSYIKYPLTDKQNGLLETKAGIPYRDENLSLDNDTIIKNRKIEVENSDLISTSKYLKGHKNEV